MGTILQNGFSPPNSLSSYSAGMIFCCQPMAKNVYTLCEGSIKQMVISDLSSQLPEAGQMLLPFLSQHICTIVCILQKKTSSAPVRIHLQIRRTVLCNKDILSSCPNTSPGQIRCPILFSAMCPCFAGVCTD